MAGGGKFYISVNADPKYKKIISELKTRVPLEVHTATVQTAERLQDLTLQVIKIQIQNAAARHSEAFPPAYMIHLLSQLSELQVETSISEYSFNIAFNFNQLGTKDDLMQGYHYGALLKSGGFVDLPWHGGSSDASLKNDVMTRYEFWTALRFNLTYKGRPIENTLWNDTINARVSTWNSLGKAPEWLLLQYGQQEWEPTLEPTPIIENTRAILKELGQEIFADELLQQYQKMQKRLGIEVSYPQKLSTGILPSLEVNTSDDLIKKQAKFNTHYKTYLIAAINAKTNEELVRNIKRFASLESVDIGVIRAILGGNE